MLWALQMLSFVTEQSLSILRRTMAWKLRSERLATMPMRRWVRSACWSCFFCVTLKILMDSVHVKLVIRGRGSPRSIAINIGVIDQKISRLGVLFHINSVGWNSMTPRAVWTMKTPFLLQLSYVIWYFWPKRNSEKTFAIPSLST